MADQPPQPPKLLDQVRTVIRLRGMSYRTEQAYVDWVKRFILFHHKRHPKEMGAMEIRDYLSHLVVKNNVAPSTQNQALHAILFLYREVLQIDLPRIDDVKPAKKEPRLPTVFTREEVQKILAQMTGTKWLMASLLYGTGMRLTEMLRLRVKDIDFAQNQITVREGKGQKDRVTMLPQSLKEPLREQLVKARNAHEGLWLWSLQRSRGGRTDYAKCWRSMRKRPGESKPKIICRGTRWHLVPHHLMSRFGSRQCHCGWWDKMPSCPTLSQRPDLTRATAVRQPS